MNEPPKQNEPHIIRLRGPWQRTVLRNEPENAPNTETVTVRMPNSWTEDLGREFAGTVRYRRMFNRPTGISDQTPICVRFEQVVGYATVSLNDQPLGTIRWPEVSGRFEISGRLQPRNQLDVEVTSVTSEEANAGRTPNEADRPEVGLVGEVRLEIG